MPRRLESCALVTESIVPYSLGTPSFLGRYQWIAIKPERLLEPFVERQMAGGMSLTLSVIHNIQWPLSSSASIWSSMGSHLVLDFMALVLQDDQH